jgi:branched-chain amino acid transport system substrate-binding protein
LITSQAKSIPGLEKVNLMSADGTFSPDMYKASGKAAVGLYNSSPDFTAFASGYKDFLDKHQKKYNEKPLSAFHAHAYDAAGILFAAIEKVAVKGSDNSLAIGRDALRKAVQATKDYKGISGTLSCDPNGDCGAPVIAVYQVTDDNVTKGQTPDKPIWTPSMAK